MELLPVALKSGDVLAKLEVVAVGGRLRHLKSGDDRTLFSRKRHRRDLIGLQLFQFGVELLELIRDLTVECSAILKQPSLLLTRRLIDEAGHEVVQDSG